MFCFVVVDGVYDDYDGTLWLGIYQVSNVLILFSCICLALWV